MSDEHVDPELLKAAEAVSDARPVDWDASAGGRAGLDRTLEKLRVLESIANVHRGAAAEAGDAPACAFRWGPLEARERIGEGAFSDVWSAWDPELRREVALKLRRDDAAAPSARRWLEEAPRLARVRHPHVVTVFGAAVHDGRAGMWMERVHGVTLEQWLERHGPMGAREAALVGVELCGALAAVHAAGLLHGDLKAANVMREGAAASPGRIVLMDFGAGTERGAGALPGFGSPLALAPEVLEGGAATPAADLYALGVLLFRLLTGRHPVEADSLAELRARLARGERASLRALRPELPPALVATLERALEPDPRARFAEAGGMERALHATLAPTSPAPGGEARRGAARDARLWALVGVAALAVAAFLAPRLVTRRAPPAASAPVTRTLPAPAPAPERAPASASARAAVAPLEAEAIFYRAGDVGPERLEGSERVATGDRLFLEVRADEPVYAYVLDEDDHGRLYTLFPLAGLDRTNPLPAGTRTRLPGASAGRAKDWRVSSIGGHERFLAILSRRPLPDLEAEVASLAHATPGRAADEAAAGPLVMRGVGELADEPAAAGGSHLAALAERLRRRASPDVWWRTLVLRDPGP